MRHTRRKANLGRREQVGKRRHVTASRTKGSSPVDVLRLSGAELLRYVLNEPDVWERLARCSGCGYQAMFYYSGEEDWPCPECGGTCKPLGIDWWTRASRRMRLACQRDPKLLPAVKAEWNARYKQPLDPGKLYRAEDERPAPLPAFPGFLSWLNAAWARVEPRGRPFNESAHYELAHVVGTLEHAGLSRGQILELLGEPDRGRRLEIYDKFPERVRRSLGAAFRGGVAALPFVSIREELRRRINWARRQWTEPRARLRGERVRVRKRPATT